MDGGPSVNNLRRIHRLVRAQMPPKQATAGTTAGIANNRFTTTGTKDFHHRAFFTGPPGSAARPSLLWFSSTLHSTSYRPSYRPISP